MKWRKSPQELIDLFESVLPGPPAVERKMFGYPAGFVNGNLFMGLFQDDLILRLPDSFRQELLAANKAKIFEAMPGRPMREYIAVPGALTCDKKELAAWVAKSFAYGASLKPKLKTSKPKKERAKDGRATPSKRKKGSANRKKRA
jgi:TfoX/Sxy family transcriptional regulator of competence genes